MPVTGLRGALKLCHYDIVAKRWILHVHGNVIYETRDFWIFAALFVAFIVVQIIRYLRWRTAFVLDRAQKFAQDNKERYDEFVANRLQADMYGGGEPVEIVFLDGPQEGLTVRPIRSEISHEWLEPMADNSHGKPRGTVVYRLYYKVNRYEVTEDE